MSYEPPPEGVIEPLLPPDKPSPTLPVEAARTKAAADTSDIDGLHEGDKDPVLNAIIKELIYHESNFIVYLDDRLRVQYRGDFDFPDGSEDMTFDLARLEALTFGHDDLGELATMRRLIAEVYAHLHGAKDAVKARACLAKADEIITTIVANRIRYLRIVAAGLVAVMVSFFGWLWISHVSPSKVPGQGITPENEFALWIPLGAIGALLSSLLRMASVNVKPFTGDGMAIFESGARILAGCIGALLLVVATKCNLLLGVLAQATSSNAAFWGLMTLSILAGASERLVPDFIGRMDGSSKSSSGSDNNDDAGGDAGTRASGADSANRRGEDAGHDGDKD